MLDWADIFTFSTSPWEIVVRGTVVFLGLTVLMRLVGQRESGGLGITDVLLVVLIADAASAGLSGDTDSIADGFLLVVTIIAWSVLLDAIAYKWPKLGRFMKARPRPLVEDGELNRRAMRREFLTEDEVLAQVRLNGLHSLDQVKRAFIEANGMISVIPVEGEEAGGAPDAPTP